MSHKQATYRVEASTRLLSMLCIGKSKHRDKINYVNISNKIYSWSTYRNYRKWVDIFLNYCKKHGKPTDLQSCKEYVNPWLQDMINRNLSAWTIGLAKASVVKLFDCPSDDFITPPKRHRADIKRSRQAVDMDGRIKADWEPLIEFCKATGLRRHELEKLQGSDLCYVNGSPYLSVKGKGGRVRTAPIVGNAEDVQEVVNKCLTSGDGLVWPDVPKKLDIHSYRAEYAQTVYKTSRRPLDSLQGHELYYCRGDRQGVAYDRQALLTASQALGHDRVSVVAEHYLWGLKIQL